MEHDEVPVGAVLVRENELIAEAHNAPISSKDPSAHAEMLAVRKGALQLDNYRLPGCTLYVSLEPCTMCFGLLVHARIKRLVYGATEPKAGVVESQLGLHKQPHFNHVVEVQGGLLAEESGLLLKQFFAKKRTT